MVLGAPIAGLVGCGMLAGLGATKVLEESDASVVDAASVPHDAATAPSEAAAPGDAAVDPIQAAQIAISRTHACAVVSGGYPGDPLDRTIRCWGSNANGALGVDPSTPSSSRPLPVAPNMTDLAYDQVAVGSGFSCATTSAPTSVQTGGYVYCWGAVPNTQPAGVHAARSDLSSYVPNQMLLGGTPFLGVVSISLGDAGGCFATSDTVFCWGGAYAPGAAPDAGMGGVHVKVNAIRVAVGRAHACALLRGAAEVDCWGDNAYSQTGTPSAANPGVVVSPSAVALPPAAGGVITIAAGDDHTCALMANGEIDCWGRNDRGQLGGGTVSRDSATPVLVVLDGSPKTGIQSLAPGDGYTCALDAKERVMCWGDDSADQLARDAGASSPDLAPALEAASTVASGGHTTCATRFGDTAMWCWGANDAQQSGQATGATVPRPTPVAW
jgi:alpha-tubulin suppressor-like RCC1 family protein